MSQDTYYSYQNQLLRELNWIWQLHKVDTLLGLVYVYLSFFMFNYVGYSKVYDVVLPFILCSTSIAYLTYIITNPQVRGNTQPYYFGLPRDRKLVWDGLVAYLMLAMVAMVLVTVAGGIYKVGSRGITPYYRFHPEVFCLPLVCMVLVLFIIQGKRSLTRSIQFLVLVTLFGLALWQWWDFSFRDFAGKHNDFIPVHELAWSTQLGIALIVLFCCLGALWKLRTSWIAQEWGELR